MPTASYAVSLLSHLAQHKTDVLKISENGTWRRNGRSYPHILPESAGSSNLFAAIRDDCMRYMADSAKRLHRDFHHLNSSQAFALNFFYPLLRSPAGKSALLEAAEVPGQLMRWEFEAVPDPSEATNFDLLLELEDSRRVYVEVKLTESSFGRGRADERRRRKLAEVYRPRLTGKVAAAALEEPLFFKNYQLLRNLSYLDIPRGSFLLLVFPMANTRAAVEATHFIDRIVDPAIRPRVRVLYAERLATDLSERVTGGVEAEAVRYVIDKYALIESTPARA